MPRCPNPRCQADYPPGTYQCGNPFCQCLLPEAFVAGRYRIETLVGLGGMGAVYRASDTFEMQQVAVKVYIAGNIGVAETSLVQAAERAHAPMIVQGDPESRFLRPKALGNPVWQNHVEGNRAG